MQCRNGFLILVSLLVICQLRNFKNSFKIFPKCRQLHTGRKTEKNVFNSFLNSFYEAISKIQVIQSLSQQKLFYRRALLNNHRSEKGPPP